MTSQKSQVSRKKLFIGIIAIAVIVFASASAYYFQYRPTPTQTTTTYNTKAALIPHPDTLVHHYPYDPQYLDPATGYEAAGQYMLMNVYETLIWYKNPSASDLQPLLADKMPTISADALTYTFTLRKGIKFHDGTPFNATAVKYSFDRLILVNDPAGPAYLYDAINGARKYMHSNMTKTDVGEYLAARGVEVVDDYTVRYNLAKPYSPMLYMFAFFSSGIVSPTAVENHGGVVPGKHNVWMDRNMVGTGPYQFVEWTPKQKLVLKAFEGYWKTPAKIKNVIIQIVPEYMSRQLAFNTGEADIIAVPATNAFDFIQRDPWITSRKVVLRTDLQMQPPGTGLTVYAGLPTIQVNYIGMSSRFPPLDNKDFRYGLSYAFDYQTFINDASSGFAEPGKGMLPKGFFGYNDKIFSFSYDPAKAKEYFLKAKAAGAYQDNVKVTLYHDAADETFRRAALLLHDSVEKLNVGVTIDVQPMNYPTLIARMRANQAPMFASRWVADFADPHANALVFADYPDGTIARRTKLNVLGLNDTVIKASQTVDPAERQRLYSEIGNRTNQEAQYIWISQATSLIVMRDWVHMTIDPTLNVPTQANPLFYAATIFYLYDISKGY